MCGDIRRLRVKVADLKTVSIITKMLRLDRGRKLVRAMGLVGLPTHPGLKLCHHLVPAATEWPQTSIFYLHVRTSLTECLQTGLLSKPLVTTLTSNYLQSCACTHHTDCSTNAAKCCFSPKSRDCVFISHNYCALSVFNIHLITTFTNIVTILRGGACWILIFTTDKQLLT
jgi:hypothetical protein